jgi:hypothetical protein
MLILWQMFQARRIGRINLFVAYACREARWDDLWEL